VKLVEIELSSFCWVFEQLKRWGSLDIHKVSLEHSDYCCYLMALVGFVDTGGVGMDETSL
jgi:hypothetical protein